jgi:hypothetical protein
MIISGAGWVAHFEDKPVADVVAWQESGEGGAVIGLVASDTNDVLVRADAFGTFLRYQHIDEPPKNSPAA